MAVPSPGDGGRSPSAGRPRPSADQIRDGVAHACARLDDLRTRLRRYGDTEPLDRLLALLRDGDEDLADVVEAIHRTVLAHEGRGVYGAPRGADHGTLPGGGDARPAAGILSCPRGRCSRVRIPRGGDGPAQDCAVFGVPLKPERLY
ncbi:hypothetical protein [Streptomyces sp. NPDC059894]|uniref:hypothetical protein n=1 Tax=unclassified Streptomyces TaxID=2593676 RepID=UPI00364F7252